MHNTAIKKYYIKQSPRGSLTKQHASVAQINGKNIMQHVLSVCDVMMH